ncbi:hypothetical protein SteCoe_34019 [Stentor coeruleus]|uniref:DNA alkylation repair enzyme n=1 Tax=Stentor coeruleus TaxID=5963 RepID=A0A1R2AVU6_9CILI|nr:hypothetical protein SteCoe_34019 [Stentor coeruleus]
MSKLNTIIECLSSMKSIKNIEGMRRFGINSDMAFGIRIPVLRALAKKHRNDHELALQLWQTGYHEARILASMVDNPKLVTTSQMDDWVQNFNSWDLCDQVCSNLFVKTPFAIEKIEEYSQTTPEFIKRTAFSMIAALTVKCKNVEDKVFIELLQTCEREAWDQRNYVKKAVNWAVRQIGKKNINLWEHAIAASERILMQGTAPARWIANDALRELKRKHLDIKKKSHN